MGVKVKEALNSNVFKDFKLLAGFNGLDREIQAVSFFGAPDGFKWIKKFIKYPTNIFISKVYLLKNNRNGIVSK